jgi:hypothetical protein
MRGFEKKVQRKIPRFAIADVKNGLETITE